MNEEELIKTLMQQGGLQIAPLDFAAMVMQKIAVAEEQATLVSDKWKRYYKIAIVSVSVLVVIAGLLLNGNVWQMLSNVEIAYISPSDLYTIAFFIPAFWALLLFSRWLDRSFAPAP